LFAHNLHRLLLLMAQARNKLQQGEFKSWFLQWKQRHHY
jgi:queuine/archaeosine tRNA-ribosyltransferase